MIFEDYNGFIYFGTDNGLDVYDGYSFQSYYTNSFDQNSMLGSKVSLLFEDSNNLIWIGTDMGISIFNPFNKTFKRPFRNNPNSEFFSNIVFSWW